MTIEIIAYQSVSELATFFGPRLVYVLYMGYRVNIEFHQCGQG